MGDVVLKQYQRHLSCFFTGLFWALICLWNFFSFLTGEQEGVVGGEVCGLPLYPLHALQVSFATTSVASLPVCVCFFGGRRGGVGRGLVGLEKTIESSRSFNYSRAFTHISKYENVYSETESVFTLDSTFKISRRDQTETCVCVCVCFFLSFFLFFFFSRFTIYIRGRERLRGRDLT